MCGAKRMPHTKIACFVLCVSGCFLLDVIDDLQAHTKKTEVRIKTQTRNVEHMRMKDSCRCTCGE